MQRLAALAKTQCTNSPHPRRRPPTVWITLQPDALTMPDDRPRAAGSRLRQLWPDRQDVSAVTGSFGARRHRQRQRYEWERREFLILWRGGAPGSPPLVDRRYPCLLRLEGHRVITSRNASRRPYSFLSLQSAVNSFPASQGHVGSLFVPPRRCQRGRATSTPNLMARERQQPRTMRCRRART